MTVKLSIRTSLQPLHNISCGNTVAMNQLISYFRTVSWMLGMSIFSRNDTQKSKEKCHLG